MSPAANRFNGFNVRKEAPMSHHSYSRCWLPLIWATLNRERFLEEYEDLVKRYGLQWVEEETVETVSDTLSKAQTPR